MRIMLEKNRHILQALLRKLPAYQPPDDVWEGLENDLSSPAPLRLDKTLPVYDPPDEVWEKIDAALTAPSFKTRPARRILPWLAGAAASLAALVWFLQPSAIHGASEASVTFSYGKEIVDDALLARDWQQDEGAFGMLERLCANSSFTCSNPDMNTLRTELDELTEARNTLENALGEYGTDADLISQLAEIERQRTTLLKKMLEYFI
jgi:hypothetical protein